MKRSNKYITENIVQEFTENGWEDSCTEETYSIARKTAQTYRDNGVPARTIKRRVINPLYVQGA